MRLVIPRRSVIEHAMVFRVDQQLLALPMQFVHEVTPSEHHSDTSGGENTRLPIHFSQLFSSASPPPTTSYRILVLASSGERLGGRNAGRQIALAVDEVVGPQEVVVRPLPPLLNGHPLLSGVSLSATGDIVLLLHIQRLVELAIARDRALTPAANDASGTFGPSLEIRHLQGERVL
jgi:chemotaxis protein histidine kinase CheA